MAKTDRFCNRAEAFEAHDNAPLSPPGGDTIGDIIAKRYSRREMMRCPPRPSVVAITKIGGGKIA